MSYTNKKKQVQLGAIIFHTFHLFNIKQKLTNSFLQTMNKPKELEKRISAVILCTLNITASNLEEQNSELKKACL